jgi:hypothetical protein
MILLIKNEIIYIFIIAKYIKMRIIHKDAALRRLFTHQDKFNVHKTLGILSIASFFYRYGFVYIKDGNLGMDGKPEDWLTMMIHISSALTGLMFHVPKKRIYDKPMIIYEEYRLHAVIFTLRCLSVFIIAVLFPNAPFYVLPIVVALHHLQADRITAKYGTPGNTAVRSTVEKLEINVYYKHLSKFYSAYQFLAIASHIFMNDHLGDLAFNALIAIQSSAFMMTLYKKKIVTGKGHILIYLSCLIISTFHIVRVINRRITNLALINFIVRIISSDSKYTL